MMPTPSGDIYDQKGNKIATDGVNDGKVFVMNNTSRVKELKKANKSLRKSTKDKTAVTKVTDASAEISKSGGAELPSAFVRGEMGKAVTRSLQPTKAGMSSDPNFVPDTKGGFHEEGGIFGVDANGKDKVIHAEPGSYSNPSIEGYAEVDVFSGENPNNYLTGDVKGTFHTHPSGEIKKTVNVQQKTYNFDQDSSDFIDSTTGKRIGDIPSAKGNSYNNYVLGTRNNTVSIYNGNGTIATFPLDKFINVK